MTFSIKVPPVGACTILTHELLGHKLVVRVLCSHLRGMVGGALQPSFLSGIGLWRIMPILLSVKVSPSSRFLGVSIVFRSVAVR